MYDIFISYERTDKVIVENLERAFLDLEFTVFYDKYIPAGKDFRPPIIENIRNAFFFIPIISINFNKSDWANQEVGFAFSLNKLTLPISIDDTSPKGFIRDIQAYNLKDYLKNINRSNYIDYNAIAMDLLSNAISSENCGEYLKNKLIKELILSGGFNKSNTLAPILFCSNNFSESELSQIFDVYIENDQVNRADMALNHLLDYLVKNIVDLKKSSNSIKLNLLLNKLSILESNGGLRGINLPIYNLLKEKINETNKI